MTPPSKSGPQSVMEEAYERSGPHPVAFVDETYSTMREAKTASGRAQVQPDELSFYVMSAVVVTAKDRDGLRADLDDRVPAAYWHTSEMLRSTEGTAQALELLTCLDAGHEACVIVHQTAVNADDTNGEIARQACFARLLESLFYADCGTHEPVRLVVMEERPARWQNRNDWRTRAKLIEEQRIDGTLRLVTTSPRTDHLLWLPDLVCSAYRQKLLRRRTELFAEVSRLSTVVAMPPTRDIANPRLP